MKVFKVDEIKNIIKELLKKNKSTYADLAEHLECSEPTVKRILGSEEMTLTRLLQICDFLKMSLSDIEALMKQDTQEKAELSEKQQNFLVQYKNHFAYLLELYQPLTPQQIAEKYKLTAKSTQKYLIHLEKFDLIKVSKNNKVRPFYAKLPPLGNGPLGMANYRALVQNTAGFFVDFIGEQIIQNPHSEKSKKSGAGFAVQSMKVDIDTFNLYVKEFEAKLQELERVARFEEKTKDPKNLKEGLIVLGHAAVEPGYKGLEILQKTFGEITNL
jgi:predicted transcriptional regulator